MLEIAKYDIFVSIIGRQDQSQIKVIEEYIDAKNMG